MDYATRMLYILGLIFLLELIAYNFLKLNLPKIWGDIDLNKSGFRFYIPFLSAISLSVFFSLILGISGY